MKFEELKVWLLNILIWGSYTIHSIFMYGNKYLRECAMSVFWHSILALTYWRIMKIMKMDDIIFKEILILLLTFLPQIKGKVNIFVILLGVLTLFIHHLIIWFLCWTRDFNLAELWFQASSKPLSDSEVNGNVFIY